MAAILLQADEVLVKPFDVEQLPKLINKRKLTSKPSPAPAKENVASILNTMLKGYWLPTIRAAIELHRKHPEKAIGLLEAASRYEMGSPSPSAQAMASLYPVYVRGEAYLKTGQGQQAAVEFQKLIDHRSIVQNFVLGALAHLQLGRAKIMSGDKEGARKAYQDFLALWKDADPDIAILKEAKTEYAKLRQ
jgi:tetratricopeptide (TPR) repeat protein